LKPALQTLSQKEIQKRASVVDQGVGSEFKSQNPSTEKKERRNKHKI
jgi:hypothetical protein